MKTSPISWRVFCAVELPHEIRVQLQDHIARLRKEIPDVAASWSRVENIHLTLKFFGNVNVDRIERCHCESGAQAGCNPQAPLTRQPE